MISQKDVAKGKVLISACAIIEGELSQLLPKSLFSGILKKRIQERVRTEFDKNGGRIRYDYFITRLDQAVLKLKRDINGALESSTETVKHAVQEAEHLQAKSELAVKSRVDELREMLVELESIKKQLDREFASLEIM